MKLATTKPKPVLRDHGLVVCVVSLLSADTAIAIAIAIAIIILTYPDSPYIGPAQP